MGAIKKALVKVALVTGASGGIGLAICEVLIGQGYMVVAADIRSSALAEPDSVRPGTRRCNFHGWICWRHCGDLQNGEVSNRRWSNAALPRIDQRNQLYYSAAGLPAGHHQV